MSQVRSGEEVRVGLLGGFLLALRRQFKGSRGAQLFGRESGAGANLLQQRGLGRLEFYEAAEHVEDVDQLCRVFGEPVVRLDVAQWRGRAAVAYPRRRSWASCKSPPGPRATARTAREAGPPARRWLLDSRAWLWLWLRKRRRRFERLVAS